LARITYWPLIQIPDENVLWLEDHSVSGVLVA
jgi:hypothetical protein